MNTREIEGLLEKFYNGTSSLSEEKRLRDFFRGTDVPGHLKSHQPLFEFFEEERQLETGKIFSVEQLLNQPDGQSGETPVFSIVKKRGRVLFFPGIAATILLLISVLYAWQHELFHTEKSRRNSFNTELAYTNASEALLMVSSNLNTGLAQISRLQMVDKAMKNMELFNKFYQYQPIIINPDELQNESIKLK